MNLRMDRADRSIEPKSGSQFRWVAAGSAAVFLISSASQASWGQGAGGNHNGTENGNGNGLSSAEKALIATGAGVGGGLIYIFLLGGRRKKRQDDDDNKAQALPQGKKVSQLKLVPSSRTIEAGDVDVFELKGLAEDGKWYSVTGREGASIEVKGEDSALVRQDGAKNAFCLPITTSSEYNGKTVTLVGRFDTLSAETSVISVMR